MRESDITHDFKAEIPSRIIYVFDDLPAEHKEFSRIFGDNPEVELIHELNPRLDDEVRAQFRRKKPDLIIVDLDLGSDIALEGFKLLKSLAEDETSKGVPVVVCSTKVDENYAKYGGRAKAAGAVGVYPRRPFPSASDFLRHIKSD